jgi:hypothetical protein
VKSNLAFIAIMAILTVLVYWLDISSNRLVLLLPITVLAIFRVVEKKRKKY